MDTNALKKFAQAARLLLIEQVTARLGMVLAEGAVARREHPAAIRKLEAAVAQSRQQVIEQAAYIWFNRFTALRFMDATGLTNPRVVSPADGATRPEILAEALAGNLPANARPEIAEYLNGTRPAHDAQAEAYRLLLIQACNDWHGPMPFLFERAADHTELLMPDDLLSPSSILARLRAVMTEEACKDVEIIGWLYQFYISEKKDQVFAGLKKNQKITAENIPAATQLFTPHWIVRYLVENSLGRLWLLNRPQSQLAAKMDYYIAPEEPETDFLRITGPEEIRICDPACGSGHMLTYAFDLLHDIYAEEGFDAAEIPGLILKHNLTGVEIDDRAWALAAFALSMKAAARLGRRRFLRMEAKPDIVVLQDVRFTPAEMQDVAAVVGKDLFTDELRETLGQFEQAKNFGSLIVPKLRDPAEALRVVQAAIPGADLVLQPVLKRVVSVLRMSEALAPRYHVVVANPPYMGRGGMNNALMNWSQSRYSDSRQDLYAMFMERASSLNRVLGLYGMVNMQSWMFLSRYELLRKKLLSQSTILSMAHIGERGFDSIGGAVVSTTAFVVKRQVPNGYKGSYVRLTSGKSEVEKNKAILGAANDSRGRVFYYDPSNFSEIPGSPIAYWISESMRKVFTGSHLLEQLGDTRRGLQPGNASRFVRRWFEVPNQKIGFGRSKASFAKDGFTWAPFNSGGEFRKWYGNLIDVVEWRSDGKSIKDSGGAIIPSETLYFKEAITWPKVGTGVCSFRWFPAGVIPGDAGPSFFARNDDLEVQRAVLSIANSKATMGALSVLSPTLNFEVGAMGNLPVVRCDVEVSERAFAVGVGTSKSDWDAYETSWDFTTLPLLHPEHRAGTLAATYENLRAHWQEMTDQMQRLEEENNRIFIAAYGLQDELTPEVPIEEITLTCNPAYRYGVKNSEEDREARLREDTVAELLHYAVGCMFGRYSLDAPGLILANQGEGPEEYAQKVPEPSFAPDRDNVLPILDADWFADDIVTRARDFLRVTFGEAKFRENLAFVEAALGKDLRRWFTRDFFDYHVRRYKKRPIYWMFSSPKGSFNALIYMHRYRGDTVSVVLNQYLREFIAKLEGERGRLEALADDPTATQGQRTKAQKDVGAVIRQIDELTVWERDVVYPMAQAKIAIDLDDGVKRNYPLFNGALKPIKGLEVADD